VLTEQQPGNASHKHHVANQEIKHSKTPLQQFEPTKCTNKALDASITLLNCTTSTTMQSYDHIRGIGMEARLTKSKAVLRGRHPMQYTSYAMRMASP